MGAAPMVFTPSYLHQRAQRNRRKQATQEAKRREEGDVANCEADGRDVTQAIAEPPERNSSSN